MKVGEKIRDKKRTPATEESIYILAGEPRFTQRAAREQHKTGLPRLRNVTGRSL